MIYVKIQDPNGAALFAGICDGSLTIKNKSLYGGPEAVLLSLWDNSGKVLERYTDLSQVESVQLELKA